MIKRLIFSTSILQLDMKIYPEKANFSLLFSITELHELNVTKFIPTYL